jgi:hypothetical protein
VGEGRLGGAAGYVGITVTLADAAGGALPLGGGHFAQGSGDGGFEGGR